MTQINPDGFTIPRFIYSPKTGRQFLANTRYTPAQNVMTISSEKVNGWKSAHRLFANECGLTALSVTYIHIDHIADHTTVTTTWEI